MPTEAPPTDEQTLQSICRDIGRFTVPRTVKNLREQLQLIAATVSEVALEAITKQCVSFGDMYRRVCRANEALSSAAADDIIDGRTRYDMSQIMAEITRHEDAAYSAAWPAPQQKAHGTVRLWMQRVASMVTLS